MVTFTKDSINVKIESDRPFEDWLGLLQSCERVIPFLLTNEEKHPNNFDLFWFLELKEALAKPKITFDQQREIEKVLSIELT